MTPAEHKVQRHLREVVASAFKYSDESAAAYRRSVGQTIASVELIPYVERTWDEHDTLRITFEDGYALSVYDGERSCCEKRYMRTDDDLADFAGATLRYIEVRTVKQHDWRASERAADDYDDVHEIQCVVIHTSKGDITLFNHNEHNGFYAGFHLAASGQEKASE